MITKDYHNHTLADALKDVESLVNVTRIKQRVVDVELITGHGVIRDKVFERLQTFGLSPSYKLGNDGCIICTIE